jgi:glycosyltransferase involved in cell wall biosynthesis
MKISIIIPTFNRAKDLEITLDSILKQAYSNYEVIVVDNGPSNDGTDVLMRRYVSTHHQIKYYRTSLAGVVCARSIGSLLATGQILLQIDDDLTFFDQNTLAKTEFIFSNFNVDVLGALALKQESQVKRVIERSHLVDENSLIKINHSLKGVGNISFLYDITKSLEQLVEEPIGVYKIESFQGCFLAYSRSAFQKLHNWDINYVKVGSKVSIREETDFLLRAGRIGLQVYYTNYTSVQHRVAERSSSLVARAQGFKHYFYYASSQSYMAMKDMLEHGSKKKIALWVIYQLFIGQSRNPGMLSLLKSKRGIGAICANFVGFFYGFMFALMIARKFIDTAEQHLIADSSELAKLVETQVQ